MRGFLFWRKGRGGVDKPPRIPALKNAPGSFAGYRFSCLSPRPPLPRRGGDGRFGFLRPCSEHTRMLHPGVLPWQSSLDYGRALYGRGDVGGADLCPLARYFFLVPQPLLLFLVGFPGVWPEPLSGPFPVYKSHEKTLCCGFGLKRVGIATGSLSPKNQMKTILHITGSVVRCAVIIVSDDSPADGPLISM